MNENEVFVKRIDRSFGCFLKIKRIILTELDIGVLMDFVKHEKRGQMFVGRLNEVLMPLVRQY